MKHALTLILLLSAAPLLAQSNKDQQSPEIRASIEDILRLQDRRTVHDGKLISLLTSKEPAVRERAVLAYGSLQDTSVLPQLVDRLTDDTRPVEAAAAFAIGQTAGLLTRKSRLAFEHDLIWTRMDRTAAQDRLIEEIGKFGSEEALRDLVQRFGAASPVPHPEALVMSAARFAIRGVTAREATEYILSLAKSSGRLRWQVAYALQRIGNEAETRAEIDDIAQLTKSDDPLVRMNIATLLGKIKDEKSSVEPLLKLAEFDGDWRVRVNALKALGNFDLNGNEEALRMFRRAVYAERPYIALTAISSLGNSSLHPDESSAAAKDLFAALEHLAVNEHNGYLWQLQAEAATALAKLEGARALPLVHPTDYPQHLLQAQLLIAMGTTGSAEAAGTLMRALADDDPVVRRSALDGLEELARKNPADAPLIDSVYAGTLHALQETDVAIVTTAASMLGDSLFLRSSSVAPLLEKLGSLHVPDDVEAMQEIASTLGRLKDRRAVAALEDLLSQADYSVSLAAAGALRSITGSDYRAQILTGYEPRYTDFDFNYLRALPETVHVKIETIRGDISCDFYKNAAPFTIMSILKLAEQRGFYRGVPFHRVVPNFVIQGGDPRGDGWGGPGYSLRSEFSPLRYETGTIGIASAGKDTEGSQFFITQSPQPHLDGRYTIIGKVTSGMGVVDKILVDDHIYDIKVLE
jgi:cyclophilin family peptidyl-prolyl cis-trans isomerase/HEAT repeat protein